MAERALTSVPDYSSILRELVNGPSDEFLCSIVDGQLPVNKSLTQEVIEQATAILSSVMAPYAARKLAERSSTGLRVAQTLLPIVSASVHHATLTTNDRQTLSKNTSDYVRWLSSIAHHVEQAGMQVNHHTFDVTLRLIRHSPFIAALSAAVTPPMASHTMFDRALLDKERIDNNRWIHPLEEITDDEVSISASCAADVLKALYSRYGTLANDLCALASLTGRYVRIRYHSERYGYLILSGDGCDVLVLHVNDQGYAVVPPHIPDQKLVHYATNRVIPLATNLPAQFFRDLDEMMADKYLPVRAARA